MNEFKVGDKVRLPYYNINNEITTGTVAECYPDVNFYAVDVEVKIDEEHTVTPRGLFRSGDLVLLDTPNTEENKDEPVK